MLPRAVVPKWMAPFRCGAKGLALIALTLVTACSSTTFIYNRLDTLAGWYVDDYVTLDPAQREDFDQRVDDLLAWHRQEELPRYASFLQRFDELLDNNLSAQDLEAIFTEISSAADRLQLNLEALLIDFGATLRVEQREEFFEALREEQAEQRERWLQRSEEEYHAEIAGRLEKNLARVMGRLNTQQRSQIETAAANFQRLDGLWLEDRDRWLLEVEALALGDNEGWVENVRLLLTTREQGRSEAYVRIFEHNSGVTRQIVGTVINERTDAQDRKLRRKLAAYRRDFEALSEGGG